MNTYTLESVKDEVDENKLDLGERLPHGTTETMALKLDVAKSEVEYAIVIIKKERGIRVKKKKNIIPGDINKFRQPFLDAEFLRSSTNQQVGSMTIAKYITRNLQCGGRSMLIGTPTPICVSDKSNYNHSMIDDELAIAHAMVHNCDHLSIIIGNSVNKEKAHSKGVLWRSLDSTRNAYIINDEVSPFTFVKHVGAMLGQKRAPYIVVLLTSGLWEGSPVTAKKLGFETTNFQSPSIALTDRDPNLHIFTLRRPNNQRFIVAYVHRGVEYIITEKLKKTRR